MTTATSSRFAALPPWVLLVTAVLSVQIGAAVAKQLFNTTGPQGVVFLRTLLAAILFLLLWRPTLRGLTRGGYAYIVAYGVNIALMMLVFYASIDRIPLGVSVAISFIGPLGIAVVGSRRRIDLLWAGLAAVGVLLLTPLAADSLDPLGVLLAFGSAASWACYILLTSRVNRYFDGQINTSLTFSMLVAALVALPFGGQGALAALANPGLLLLSLVVAALSSAIPFALEFVAMRRMSPRAFGLLLALEPVVAALVGLLLLSEALSTQEALGVVLVTIAAVATARGE
ncbi:MAG: EamA family transporter [Anaerolineae bacterium]|nr:EamA family transporter [Anaerolineae bacterium]